jgi:ribose-phosphate pyrophosphokinase
MKKIEVIGTHYSDDKVRNAVILIVDDICDGGRTFIELAKKLRPMTTGKIKLLITHGIFSKGIEVFDGIIDEVLVINNIGGAVSTSSVVVRDIWLG